MKISRIWLVITMTYFILMALVSLFGPFCLRRASPGVELAKLEGGYIKGKWYNLIIPDAAIVTSSVSAAVDAAGDDNSDGSFICRLVVKKDFWTEGMYCSFYKVEIAAFDEEGERTAITGPMLTDRDMIIVKWNKPLSEGCRIFALP